MIASQLGRVGSQAVLEFADLIEVRFLEHFRNHGVSWRAIRIAADRARRLLNDPHPFLTTRFRTDGRHLFAEMGTETSDPVLLDLVHNEYRFHQIIEEYLIKDLDYDENGLFRWHPIGRRRRVLVDRRVRFGSPIVYEGVPTSVLANAAQAEGSIHAAAQWYEVSEASVRDAVRFETR